MPLVHKARYNNEVQQKSSHNSQGHGRSYRYRVVDHHARRTFIFQSQYLKADSRKNIKNSFSWYRKKTLWRFRSSALSYAETRNLITSRVVSCNHMRHLILVRREQPITKLSPFKHYSQYISRQRHKQSSFCWWMEVIFPRRPPLAPFSTLETLFVSDWRT